MPTAEQHSDRGIVLVYWRGHVRIHPRTKLQRASRILPRIFSHENKRATTRVTVLSLEKEAYAICSQKNPRAGFAVRIERTDHPARSEKARKTQHKKFHLPCNAPATCRARGMRARWCENNTPKVTATVLPWMKNKKKKKSQTLWTDATNIKKTPPLRLNAWGSIKPV